MSEMKDLRQSVSWSPVLSRNDSNSRSQSIGRRQSVARRISNASAIFLPDDMEQANKSMRDTMLRRVSTYSIATVPFDEKHDEEAEEEIVYPSGAKLWLTYASLCMCIFLNGLDLTIVAVAVPKLTDQFRTVADIGWYSAAYSLVASAFVFFFGKVYTVFSMKYTIMFGLAVFEIGSIICTFAVSSKMFIFGRAVAGFGTAALGGGFLKLLKQLFPMSKLALMGSIVGGCQSIGMVSSPVIGGALIDGFTWRACFGINIPLGVLCLAFIWFCFEDTKQDQAASELSLKEKLKRLDLLGTTLAVPAITLLLLALQWGGTTYPWASAIIIVFFVLAGLFFIAFIYLQHRQGDNATVPPRIAKQRSLISGIWFASCCNGILAVTEYYISIYFQGVRGYSATASGLLGIPMVIAGTVGFLFSGLVVSKIGYYYPFMIATSVLTPIASGLLTTIKQTGTAVKPAALLAFIGFSTGLGMQGPQLAVQTTIETKDVSIGGAMIMFGSGIGSSLWIVLSATLFHQRLLTEIRQNSPGVDATALAHVGLSDIRAYVGPERLPGVLEGYNKAVIQTLYLPLALAILTFAGSLTIERKSMKEAKE